ncbi:AAA family ATPase [Spirillospora sp. NPDC029432]|uniref:AAA family ATPase n=1 Tax=Spirillospora sp. NPDC029432 TaxID=3154599 RepID=UPI0034513F45
MCNSKVAPDAAELAFAIGDVVIVSGLPGSGKSTLIERAVADLDAAGGLVARVDSQHVRDAWERGLPGRMPYAVLRPAVRVAHYVRLHRRLRPDGGAVVHDCGAHPWVRRLAAYHARRRGRRVHLVLLDVPPRVALEGQARRRRRVSRRAFRRHVRAFGRLVADAKAGRPPDGCRSAVLLDRDAADALKAIRFK